MLILKGTTETLEITTSTTAQLDIAVVFSDQTGKLDTYHTTVAAATTVPILQPPSFDHVQRLISTLSIVNVDTTDNTVIIKKDISATDYAVTPELSLLAGESAFYSPETGWVLYDANGIQKKSPDGVVSSVNSSTTPLAGVTTFTGVAELNDHPDIMVVCKTDQNGVLYIDFSPDGTNWDSTLTYDIVAGINDFHIARKGPRYVRVRLANTSAGAQTYLRLYSYFGKFSQGSSPLNSTIQTDADSIAVRPLDFNLMVAQGLYQNTSNTIKDGINPDVRSGSVPEDIWYSGGTYTGFPTGAVEAGEIVVAGADTGTVYYSYLESSTSTDYVFGSKAIAGAGTYALGHNIWRCNFAYFVTSSSTAFNVGDITIRNTPTTTNVFTTIPTGFSQSYTAAYTVPFGSAIYIDRITALVRGATNTSLDGHFWYRAPGESPRLRFPFNVQFGSLYFDDVDYLIRIPALTDIMPRIINSTSASAAEAEISYRFLKVKS